jgi:hypothetical protein
MCTTVRISTYAKFELHNTFWDGSISEVGELLLICFKPGTNREDDNDDDDDDDDDDD